MFAADLAAVPFLADNLEAEPVCVARCRRIWFAESAAPPTDCNLCAPAAQHGNLSRQGSGCCRCRCSLLDCLPSPPAALLWRWSWCRCRAPRTACRAVSPGAFAASGGVSCLFLCCREVGGSFCAGLGRPSGPCASWLPPFAWLWRSTGPPFPALPLNSPAHRTRSRRPATPATTRRTLPPRKAPRKPGPVLLPPLPGRSGVTGILVSVTPDGAAPASNGRQRRPCRLLPCAAGFVQNPSSECPTTRLQSGTKHYGVYLANHDALAVLTRLESLR